MARRLYGFLNDLIAGYGELIDADGISADRNDVTGRDDVVLFVPGSDVNVLSAIVPVRSESEARRAAPFVIEDEIAVSVDEAHFALGPAQSDIQVPRMLHVVSPKILQEWVDWLADAPEFRRAKLVAEQSVLAPDEAYDVEGRCVANISGHAFAIDAAMPVDVRKAVLKGREPSALSKTDFLVTLAGKAEASGGLVDLRQGQFRPRAGGAGLTSLRQWRLSACLAAAIAVAWCAGSFAEISNLNKQASDIDASIEIAFAEALPDVPEPTNYVRAVSRAVNAQGGGKVAFREVSAALYVALQYVPDAQLLSIRYDKLDGELVARIAYSAYGNDAELKDALVGEGFIAELGDARQERLGVVGDVTISRGAS